MASARSRLSRPFSFSNIFSLHACDTSQYFAFYAHNVALRMPCLRQMSAAFIPPSCSRRTAAICSSLNLVFSTSVSSRRRALAQVGGLSEEHVRIVPATRAVSPLVADPSTRRSAHRNSYLALSYRDGIVKLLAQHPIWVNGESRVDRSGSCIREWLLIQWLDRASGK